MKTRRTFLSILFVMIGRGTQAKKRKEIDSNKVIEDYQLGKLKYLSGWSYSEEEKRPSK
ncbi:hypothetical protein HBN50_13640 [Halobacteriovorax sp. GB3]|uniref:hypothetical protein n=1 Tax=Halobacteriovorax sp. GB3 TaxID=2719615 RepID=UPI0023619E93|nr:hypothetical protein [Halobacteriovorax sp. GB3]MDD0854150.1 hypothetical protein [Halobacteriovorax sp. GB3]